MNIEDIKQQIAVARDAVKDLEEPFKSRAFAVILSKLLDEIEAIQKSPIGTPLIVGKTDQIPSISKTTTCREAIASLFTSDWGRQPRSLREIIDAMKTNAVYYPDQNVAVELKRMTQLGLLRRLKDQKGFKYVSAKLALT